MKQGLASSEALELRTRLPVTYQRLPTAAIRRRRLQLGADKLPLLFAMISVKPMVL
jgi:hypothetical protein